MLKKVVADQVAMVVDPVFGRPDAYATSTIWTAVVCYAVQIYCDFSGPTTGPPIASPAGTCGSAPAPAAMVTLRLA
jgi:hypothetical protein